MNVCCILKLSVTERTYSGMDSVDYAKEAFAKWVRDNVSENDVYAFELDDEDNEKKRGS